MTLCPSVGPLVSYFVRPSVYHTFLKGREVTLSEHLLPYASCRRRSLTRRVGCPAVGWTSSAAPTTNTRGACYPVFRYMMSMGFD